MGGRNRENARVQPVYDAMIMDQRLEVAYWDQKPAIDIEQTALGIEWDRIPPTRCRGELAHARQSRPPNIRCPGIVEPAPWVHLILIGICRELRRSSVTFRKASLPLGIGSGAPAFSKVEWSQSEHCGAYVHPQIGSDYAARPNRSRSSCISNCRHTASMYLGAR